MNDALTLENLSVCFNGRHVLQNVSASFPASGISVLIGRSGSGKTTLLRAINRLNEEFAGCVTTGQIHICFRDGWFAVYPDEGPDKGPNDGPDNRSGGSIALPELRTRVGMVFQTPNLFPVSVKQNLSIPLKWVRGFGKREVEDRIRFSLESVGLWKELDGRLDMPAERLSGGQQQRLCLARTLSLEPEVLLLDEPTASLDVHAAKTIEKLLMDLSETYVLIMVSHSLSQARRMGNRIFICEEGRISGMLETDADVSDDVLARLL